jgi:hypothetical protein
MYIRKSSRTTKGKTYFNYVLVESVLTPRGPRQKVICSLGDLRPRPQADWLALACSPAMAAWCCASGKAPGRRRSIANFYQKLRIGSEIVNPRKTWSTAEEGSK